MLRFEEQVVYKVFGLSIISEIPLPELPRIGIEADSVDIEIEMEDLTKQWSELADNNNEFVIHENLVMYKIFNIAIFSIRGGRKISVSTLKEYQ
jgi:hypothetical protein